MCYCWQPVYDILHIKGVILFAAIVRGQYKIFVSTSYDMDHNHYMIIITTKCDVKMHISTSAQSSPYCSMPPPDAESKKLLYVGCGLQHATITDVDCSKRMQKTNTGTFLLTHRLESKTEREPWGQANHST